MRIMQEIQQRLHGVIDEKSEGFNDVIGEDIRREFARQEMINTLLKSVSGSNLNLLVDLNKHVSMFAEKSNKKVEYGSEQLRISHKQEVLHRMEVLNKMYQLKDNREEFTRLAEEELVRLVDDAPIVEGKKSHRFNTGDYRYFIQRWVEIGYLESLEPNYMSDLTTEFLSKKRYAQSERDRFKMFEWQRDLVNRNYDMNLERVDV